MITERIFTDSIVIGERHRALNQDKIRMLAGSIETIGLQHPISVWFDADVAYLIAGRHRLDAAISLGWDQIDAIVVDLSPVDRELWEIDENLCRADLTPAEEAQHLARRKELWRERENQQVTQVAPPVLPKGHTQEKGFAADTAKATGQSKSSINQKISRAEKIAPDVLDAIQGTDLDKGICLDILKKLDPAEQLIAIAGGKKAILRIAKTIRDDRSAKRRGERIAKIAAIALGNSALSIDTRYPVIYADPPWEYDFQPSEDRSSENHYPSMSLADICAVPVSELATPDAMLYLWATAPKLEEALAVVKAWGFDYRTSFVWAKDKIGMGRYCRNQHEYLLVCRRGNIPIPPVKARFSSLVHAPRTGHSEKPERFYEIIEAAYPELPKIELFSRKPRENWTAWGNQVETS